MKKGAKKPTPTPAIRFLTRVISRPRKKGERYGWHHIISAIHHVGQDPSAPAERTLERIVAFKGSVSLTSYAGVPHSMSPEDMMRSLALQSLLQRDKPRHRKLAHRLAASTRIDLLAGIAKTCAK
jgi:hypothetical protein